MSESVSKPLISSLSEVKQFELNTWRFTANWLTIARTIPTLVMVYFFQAGQWELGGWCYLLAIIPDWFDGPLARRQHIERVLVHIPLEQADWRQRWINGLPKEIENELSYWERMNFPGVTHLGKWLDPVLDKIMNATCLLMVGYGFVAWQFVAAIVALDICLQFLVRPLKQHWNIGDDGANPWGKYKTQAQGWTAGIMVFVRAWHWPFESTIMLLIHTGLALAIAFAIMSIYRHLRPLRH